MDVGHVCSSKSRLQVAILDVAMQARARAEMSGLVPTTASRLRCQTSPMMHTGPRSSRKDQSEVGLSAREPSLVARAAESCGLLDNDSESFHTFGLPFAPLRETAYLQEATKTAQAYLLSPETPTAGAALIDRRVLNTHIMAMASLVPGLASEEGRPYCEERQTDWHAVVTNLCSVLSLQHGQVHDASSMIQQVRQVLSNHMQASHFEVERIAFFSNADVGADSLATRDLEVMLSYITVVCMRQHAERAETKAVIRQKRQAAREATEAERVRARRLRTLLP